MQDKLDKLRKHVKNKIIYLIISTILLFIASFLTAYITKIRVIYISGLVLIILNMFIVGFFRANKYNHDKICLMNEAVNSKLKETKLDFNYEYECTADSEILENLNMMHITNAFYMTSHLYGKYKETSFDSYSLRFKPMGQKGNVIGRIYCFNFKDEPIFNLFNDDFTKEGTYIKKYAISKNKLYIVLLKEVKLRFNLLSFEIQDYDNILNFNKRIDYEIKFIKKVIENVKF